MNVRQTPEAASKYLVSQEMAGGGQKEGEAGPQRQGFGRRRSPPCPCRLTCRRPPLRPRPQAGRQAGGQAGRQAGGQAGNVPGGDGGAARAGDGGLGAEGGGLHGGAGRQRCRRRLRMGGARNARSIANCIVHPSSGAQKLHAQANTLKGAAGGQAHLHSLHRRGLGGAAHAAGAAAPPVCNHPGLRTLGPRLLLLAGEALGGGHVVARLLRHISAGLRGHTSCSAGGVGGAAHVSCQSRGCGRGSACVGPKAGCVPTLDAALCVAACLVFALLSSTAASCAYQPLQEQPGPRQQAWRRAPWQGQAAFRELAAT